MRYFLCLCAILAPGLQAFALEPLPTDQPYCGLVQPPDDAKVFEIPHGNKFKLHPLAPGASYTGCVWLWSNADTQLVIVFERGQPKYYRDVDSGRRPRSLECSYEGSTLVRRTLAPKEYTSGRCPSSEELREYLEFPQK